jgi:hypothetical protein
LLVGGGMRSAVPYLFSSAFVLAAASGCTSEEPIDENEIGSADSAVVSREEFGRALGIVRDLDYLPFEYKVNGCYARAFYMSMELASRGIESNAIYAFARSKTPAARLRVGETTWGYHVAPMLMLRTTGNNSVPRVVDPSISTEPLTREGWLSRMGHREDEPEATKPTVFYVQGSDYSNYSPSGHPRSRDVPDFESLAPFNVTAIQDACGVMYEFIACDRDQSAEDRARKREKLLERTKALLTSLERRGKLNADARFSETACKRYENVACEGD